MTSRMHLRRRSTRMLGMEIEHRAGLGVVLFHVSLSSPVILCVISCGGVMLSMYWGFDVSRWLESCHYMCCVITRTSLCL